MPNLENLAKMSDCTEPMSPTAGCEWFCSNDIRIKDSSAADMSSKSPHMLIYTRVVTPSTAWNSDTTIARIPSITGASPDKTTVPVKSQLFSRSSGDLDLDKTLPVKSQLSSGNSYDSDFCIPAKSHVSGSRRKSTHPKKSKTTKSPMIKKSNKNIGQFSCILNF